jgi:hypothetical protein
LSFSKGPGDAVPTHKHTVGLLETLLAGVQKIPSQKAGRVLQSRPATTVKPPQHVTVKNSVPHVTFAPATMPQFVVPKSLPAAITTPRPLTGSTAAPPTNHNANLSIPLLNTVHVAADTQIHSLGETALTKPGPSKMSHNISDPVPPSPTLNSMFVGASLVDPKKAVAVQSYGSNSKTSPSPAVKIETTLPLSLPTTSTYPTTSTTEISPEEVTRSPSAFPHASNTNTEINPDSSTEEKIATSVTTDSARPGAVLNYTLPKVFVQVKVKDEHDNWVLLEDWLRQAGGNASNETRIAPQLLEDLLQVANLNLTDEHNASRATPPPSASYLQVLY